MAGSLLAVALDSPPASATPCAPAPGGTADARPATGSGFVPVVPRRLADTRDGAGGVPPGLIDRGCVLRVELAGLAPADATAAVLTVTADGATVTSFVTGYRCGGAPPGVSQLNPRRNDPVAGLAVIPLDSSMAACFYVEQPTHLIVDLVGWYTQSGEPLHEMVPERYLDTRSGPRPTDLPPGKPVDGAIVRIPIAGATTPSGVPVPRRATAVAVSVTITNAVAATYATAYPCGAAPPGTSTVNTLRGNDRGAPALIGLDASGALCIFTERSADLIVDVTGWFGPDDPDAATLDPRGSPVREFSPVRLADSRTGTGNWFGRFAAGETRRLGLLSRVPIGATAVQIGVIAVNATGPGYLTLSPCGAPRPTVSAVNFRAAQPESALATIGLSDPAASGGAAVAGDGDVCIYSSAVTDVVVDLVAVFGGSTAMPVFEVSPRPEREPMVGQPDHAIRCPAAGGPVSIQVAASPGALVSINGGTGARRLDETISMKPGDLAGIAVSHPGGIERTYIRCLPTDFPRLVGTGRSPTPGWVMATNAGPGAYAFILDEYGVPVWYQRTPYPVIGLWRDGTGGLAWRNWTGGGFPTEVPPLGFELRSLTGELTGTVEIPGGVEAVDWHEFLTLANGNRLVVTYPRRDLPAATKVPCTDTQGTKRTTNVMIDSDIVELDPSGAEVWRWSSVSHVAASETLVPICFQLADGAFGLDLVHVNAVDLFPDGDLLVTARHLNAVFRVDRTSGAVEWKLGGTAPKEGSLLALAGDPRGGPRGPHDGRVLPNGNVTIHDNHIGQTDNVSRVVEYAIGPTTATLVWSHGAGTLKSGTLGSARRLADGTTLIGWGTGTSPWLEQVDPDGNVVHTVAAQVGTVIYRAEPAPASAFDRDALRAAAGRTALPAP